MLQKDWQKAYAPRGDALEIRVQGTLASLQETERRLSMKKMMALALAALLVLASVAALAAGIVFSAKANTQLAADKALERAYGITKEMLTYFRRSEPEQRENGTVVTYTGMSDFAYVLGTYTVTLWDNEAEVVWSRDGEATDGGFDAKAWGAEQLEAALAINRETLSFGEVYQKALAHAQAAGEEKYEAPEPQDAPSVPEGYQSWAHYYRAMALPVMEIAPKDAIRMAKDAIVQRYGLTAAQLEKMVWHDTWTDFGMADDTPVLNVWFWLSQNESAWSQGDGLYGAAVNVQTGVIEEMYYDSALAGNG